MESYASDSIESAIEGEGVCRTPKNIYGFPSNGVSETQMVVVQAFGSETDPMYYVTYPESLMLIRSSQWQPEGFLELPCI